MDKGFCDIFDSLFIERWFSSDKPAALQIQDHDYVKINMDYPNVRTKIRELWYNSHKAAIIQD